MNRYVDAEVYENKLDKYCDANCKYTEKERYVMCDACELGIAFEILEDTPTADVRENKRGEWLRHYDEDGDADGYSCSVCAEWYYFGNTTPNFCPNCGSDMRGDNNDRD